jgi:hypothetical protein
MNPPPVRCHGHRSPLWVNGHAMRVCCHLHYRQPATAPVLTVVAS